MQDDTPTAEGRYRARLLFDPNGFDPGEARGSYNVRLFVGHQGASTRVVTILLRRRQGQYSVQGQTLLQSGSLKSTAFVNVTDAPHSIEFDWRRATPSGAAFRGARYGAPRVLSDPAPAGADVPAA